jgi:hypothetical protein
MTPNHIYLAIIAALITVIVGPAIKKYFFDPRMRVFAEVRAWRAKTKNLVAKKIAEAVRPSDTEEWRILNIALEDSSYVELKLTNGSTRKLTSVSVIPRGFFTGTYQIENSDHLLKIERDVVIQIGDIIPKHERTIHFWLMTNVTDYPYTSLKKAFEVSADEIDSVRIKLPAPGYLQDRLRNRLLWIGPLAWFFVAILVGYGIMYAVQIFFGVK